jgi:hypothetical protein
MESPPIPCPPIPPLPCTPDPKEIINAAQRILPILNTVFTDKSVATNLRNIMIPFSPYVRYLKDISESLSTIRDPLVQYLNNANAAQDGGSRKKYRKRRATKRRK